MNKPVRAALQARVSTTGHQDVGLQVEELRAVAKQRGLVLVAEFVDEGVSGATTSRPGFDAMMRAAQAGSSSTFSSGSSTGSGARRPTSWDR